MSNTRRSSRNTSARIDGLVIAVFGRHYLVETKDNIALDCVVRGKRSGVACGDQVEILPTAPGQGVIEKIKPRMTILHRSDAFREKIIAANITQIIVVVAAIPSFSEELINRCLIAAENQCIKALIVLNKADMIVPTRSAAVTLSLYQELGYPLIQMSANKDISSLIPYLKGNVSVLAGQSVAKVVNGTSTTVAWAPLNPQAPMAPTELVATPGNEQVSIAFTPGYDGGSAIINYEYSINADDPTPTWTAFDPAVTTSPVTITGLTNGTQYEIALRAVNDIGIGDQQSVYSIRC